ncbi:hypothetical protein AB1L42_00010 [Thalassoglobus sp. JC818]|uniref:hypothetical protein n=1 Tax=Thalassoglobus sp. JC818 TaxID=3232136 RepID=UPI0034584035
MKKLLAFVVTLFLVHPHSGSGGELPQSPRIESVVLVDNQLHEHDSHVIWYDDFDDETLQDQYPEKEGDLTDSVRFGGTGKSLKMQYDRGSKGIGGRRIFFGDSPTYTKHVLRNKESFDDVYWRIYVKHPIDWAGGGPAKLSRATSLVPPGWRQAMIAHVWSSGDALTLDPASGVKDGALVSTRYNDFENLRWLGNRPASEFKLHGRDGLGWWVCVEARAKLNTPGKKDGINQLWIDGKLESERTNLDWRGTFNERGINAVFLEAYWNQGSPVDQARWVDNFVVSTAPIGPVYCNSNPTLIKSKYVGPGQQQAWEVELALVESDLMTVWRSNLIDSSERVTVDVEHGQFINELAGKNSLPGGKTFVSRVRQQSKDGDWSPWSPWHQTFRTMNR